MKYGKKIDKLAISHLSKQIRRASWLRNFVAACAICLTTILFTTVFTLTFSLINSFEIQALKEVGTTAHGCYKGITTSKYEALLKNNKIKDISYNVMIGEGANKELSKFLVEIRYTEEKAAGWNYCALLEGRFPTKENEIVMDDIALELLKLEPKIGSNVHLDIKVNGQILSKDFKLCGYYKGNRVTNASELYVSKEFLQKDIYSIAKEEEWEKLSRQGANGSGLINAFCILQSKTNIEKQLQTIWKECGFKEEADIGVNWVYERNGFTNMDWKAVLGIIAILFVIMFAGYLIIYNIFHIAAVNDTKLYGLIKLIGMSKKQMKLLLVQQINFIYMIGAPIGLFIGLLLGNLLMPTFLNILSGEYENAFVINPFIFLFSAIFTYITVFVGMSRPCKMVSEMSSMEALRYNGSLTLPMKSGKADGKVTMWLMAYRNLFRNKNKSLLVIISISLVIILFIQVSTLIMGINFDNFIKLNSASDFYISTSSLLNDFTVEKIEKSVYDEMASNNGITSISPQYYQLSLHLANEIMVNNIKSLYDRNLFSSSEDPEIKKSVSSLIDKGTNGGAISENRYYYSKDIIKKFQVLEGKIDYEKLKTGKYVIIIARIADVDGISIYHPGDQMVLFDWTKDSKVKKNAEGKREFTDVNSRKYEVMAVVAPKYSLSIRSSSGLDLNTLFLLDEYKKPENAMMFSISIDVDKEKIDEVEHYIKTYIDGHNELDYTSIKTVRDSYNSLRMLFLLSGGGMTVFIALISILNFINSIATGMITRRKEFAVLQSIGMRKKQLLFMLQAESLYYVLLAGIVSLVVGSILSLVFLSQFSKVLLWFEYRYTVLPTFVLTLVLAVFAVFVPRIVYKVICRGSIVDELHTG